MKLTKFIPFLMVPALAMGCAPSADDDTGSGEGAATAEREAGVEFSASVGAVVINGEKVCTAALVDVDAGAKIKVGNAEVSARGRQVLMGGACLGKLSANTVGVAAFVTHKGELAVSTPFLSFDIRDKEHIAIGILASAPDGTTPAELATAADVRGFFASTNAGAHVANIIEVDKHGIAIGAAAEVHAGVKLDLKTKCTEFHFLAKAGVAVGASVALKDDGLGAAAFIKVNGKLKLAAHIDGKCIVEQVAEKIEKIATATIKAANDVGDALSSIGQTGQVAGVFYIKEANHQQRATVTLPLPANGGALRVNSQGHVSAWLGNADSLDAAISSGTAGACDRVSLGFINASCELAPPAGFKASDYVTLTVDLHGNFFPDGPNGQRVVVTVAGSPKFSESHVIPADAPADCSSADIGRGCQR